MLIAAISGAGLWTPAIWTFCAVFGIIGLIALVSPTLFARLTHWGNRWVDTSRFLAKLDTRVDVDEKVLPHCRWLGLAVVASVGVIWQTLGR